MYDMLLNHVIRWERNARNCGFVDLYLHVNKPASVPQSSPRFSLNGRKQKHQNPLVNV